MDMFYFLCFRFLISGFDRWSTQIYHGSEPKSIEDCGRQLLDVNVMKPINACIVFSQSSEYYGTCLRMSHAHMCWIRSTIVPELRRRYPGSESPMSQFCTIICIWSKSKNSNQNMYMRVCFAVILLFNLTDSWLSTEYLFLGIYPSFWFVLILGQVNRAATHFRGEVLTE